MPTPPRGESARRVGSRTLLEPNTTPDVTWAAVEEACRRRYREIDDGRLVIAIDGPEKAAIVDGALSLPAPCEYCDYPVLCGRAFKP